MTLNFRPVGMYMRIYIQGRPIHLTFYPNDALLAHNFNTKRCINFSVTSDWCTEVNTTLCMTPR